MTATANATKQTPDIINLPDRSRGGYAPKADTMPNEPVKPDEHVPPVEVPGRPETPGHVPEKS